MYVSFISKIIDGYADCENEIGKVTARDFQQSEVKVRLPVK